MSRPRRILLVAYFYPPCRDTGTLRAESMVRHLRALGHDVTVLTTSAYGELPDDDAMQVLRSADAQRWRARLHGSDHVDALYDADTYGGKPHFLSKVIVPEPLALAWAPFARSKALRAPPRAALRRRDHDLAARVGAPDRPHAAAPRGGLARRRARRVDLRAAAPQVSDRGSSAAWTSVSSAAGSARRTRWSASPSPPRPTCAPAASPTRS